MAKKREGVNRSEVIREAFKKHGMDSSANAIVAALKAEHGIDVSVGLVYQVKNKLSQGHVPGRRGRPGRKPAALAAAPVVSHSGGGLSIGHLQAAKAFIDSVGGVSQAKSALDALVSLVG